MPEIATEILMIVALVLINGVLSMAEFAIISARKSHLQQRSKQGNQKASVALELATDPTDFLSTVQIGITLVGVLAGAFGGATIAQSLSTNLSRFATLAPYSEEIAVGLVVVFITSLSLIFGELVPKRLALSFPENLAIGLASPMKRLSQITSPLVRLLSAITDLVIKGLGIHLAVEMPVTEDEIRVMIAQATRAGIFKKAEQDLVSGVFRLGDRRAGALITPRTEIEWLDLDDPVEANLQKASKSRHSCFPVASGSLDNICGVVIAKDLLRCSLSGEAIDLESCMVPPVYIPENMPALAVLEIFKSTQPHLALVIDEFGGVQGLLTIRDILESIVGDFPGADGAGEQQAFRRADGSWLVDGMLPVDEFMEALQLSDLPDYKRGFFQTVGGFVLNQLGRIPVTGDVFEWSGLNFEIVDMDGMRVDKILVKKADVLSGSPNNL